MVYAYKNLSNGLLKFHGSVSKCGGDHLKTNLSKILFCETKITVIKWSDLDLMSGDLNTLLVGYSNHLNTELVQYWNDRFVYGCQMVVWKPDWKKPVNGPKCRYLNGRQLNHLNTGHPYCPVFRCPVIRWLLYLNGWYWSGSLMVCYSSHGLIPWIKRWVVGPWRQPYYQTISPVIKCLVFKFLIVMVYASQHY